MSPDVDPSSDEPEARPQHNILVSIPRTASNLVTHLLALPTQPSVLAHPRNGYFYLPALSARYKHATFTRPLAAWSASERESLQGALSQSASAWQTWVADADKTGKATYVKEHVNWMLAPGIESAVLDARSANAAAARGPAHSRTAEAPRNPTAVPDAFWPRVRTTLLIRHPALTFPSTLRAALANEGLDTVVGRESERVMRWECTYEWHVSLYRFLIALALPDGQEPLIVDASQLQDPGFVRGYAKEVSLDAGLVRTSWNPASPEEQRRLHAVERRMKDTLLASNGVLVSKLSSHGIDIEAEKGRWAVEFGLQLTQRLEVLVDRAMEDYQWLYERRWRGSVDEGGSVASD
ncbi:hypothetical protein E8E12_006028 [Didymella heteroderae]|uniref:Uncharacterized protein n=1 Tax=Didymella heteroderae TaxID=1769908 RepID=A0A9P4WL23_9PLEO|nr:hypothetical protein E8E12_006028 [Didymella heteroderae]